MLRINMSVSTTSGGPENKRRKHVCVCRARVVDLKERPNAFMFVSSSSGGPERKAERIYVLCRARVVNLKKRLKQLCVCRARVVNLKERLKHLCFVSSTSGEP